MDHDEQRQAAFVHTLRLISDLSEESAIKAWYTIHSPVRLAPETQAKVYAGLYGLTKTRRSKSQ